MSELFKAIGLEDESGMTALRAFAEPTSPDEAARSQQVGQQLGLPAPVVRSDLSGFATEAEREAAQRMLKGKPRLIDWLNDLENAAVARDDLEPLGKLESFGDLATRRGQEVGHGFSGVIQSMARARSIDAATLERVIKEQAPEQVQQARQTIESLSRVLESGISPFSGEPMSEDERAVYRQRIADARVGVDAWLEKAESGIMPVESRTGAKLAERIREETVEVIGEPPRDDSFWSQLAYGAGSMGAFVLPGLAGPAGLAVTAQMGSDAAKDEAFTAAKQAGASDREAETAATIAGFVGYSEVAPIAAAFRAIPDPIRRKLAAKIGGIVSGIAAGSIEEAVQEGFMAAAQNMIAQGLYDPERGLAEGVGEQALIGAILGGFLGGGGAVISRRYGPDVERAAESGRTAETLEEIDATVAQSKLRERAPDRFRSFLDMTDLSRLSLSVPAEDLRIFYQAKDSDVDFDGLEIDREAFEDALLSGGDVSIKGSVYAAKISGSEDATWFHENATLDADEMSLSEARRFNEEATTILMEEAERAEGEFRAEMEARASDAQVRDSIFSQLREAGRSPDVAEREAAVWGAFFRTMGERYGEDPLDLAREFGVRIEGPERAGQARVRGNLDVALNTLRETEGQTRPGPLRGLIRSVGGIDPSSTFAQQMRQRGLTDPGLYRKGGAKLDQLVASEHELLTEHTDLVDQDTGLVDPDAFIEALVAEQGGERRVTAEERDQQQALADLEAEIRRLGLTLDATNDEIAEALEKAQADGEALFQPAFHGSPHVFDRFSLEHVGTGEGAQAFGWGLYFTSRKGIAEYYRDELSGFVELKYDGETVLDGPFSDPIGIAVGTLVETVRRAERAGKPMTLAEAREFWIGEFQKTVESQETRARDADPEVAKGGTFNAEQARKRLEVMRKIDPDKIDVRKQGRLFEVDVPEADELLDWDKPLSEQPEGTREKLATLGVEAQDPEAIQAELTEVETEKQRVAEDRDPVSNRIRDEQAWHDLARRAEALQSQARMQESGAALYNSLARRFGSDRAASEALREAGIPGHVYDAGSLSGQRSDARNFVIYDESRIDVRRFEQENRGAISFPAEGMASGETVIRLFESADLSTFLHESGHFFLEAFGEIAAREDAPADMQADMETIRKFLGNEGEAWTTEQQEKWARGFEAYLIEGKSPSLELADAFARFKAWLTRIYRSIRGLNVDLTPEIREVMDRMLATEQEISAARDQAAMDPLFSAAPPGMTDAEFRAYQRLARRATQQAEQTLLEKTMAKVRRQRKAWFREEKKAVRKEVEAEINRRREYRLIELLANQRWLGEETGEVPDIRLDRRELVDRFGAGIIAEIDRTRLGGKRAIYAENGSRLDTVADLFGFRDADEMIGVLQNTRKRREAIAAEVDRRMAERHGDPLSDGSIEEEALAAIHVDQQARTVAAEARQLARQTGKDTRNITARIFRQRARAMLGRMRVADVRSGRFLQAERQAARSAQREFAKVAGGKGREALAAAQRFKEQQLLNHYFYVEARDLEAEVRRGRERMRRYENRKVREKLAGGYIEQIDAILEGYEFRKRSRRAVARMESLREYVERMTEEGRANELAIDDRLMDEANRKHYTRLTVDEIRGLFDTVENIDHMGRFKQKLIDAQRKRDLDEVVAGIRQAFTDNVDGTPPSRVETRGEKLRKVGRDYLNLTLNADTLLREIDGYQDLGVTWRNLKQSIDEGMARVAERREQMADDLEQLYGVYSRKEQRDMARKQKIEGVETSLSKWDVLSIALNTGNEQNYQRLVSGGQHAIPADQVDAALATLEERDWRFVQSVWDYLEGYWPEIEAKEKRLTGTAPKKVAAKPMVPAHSFLRGGYYPIRYDSRLSGTVGDFEAKELAETMMAGRFGKAQTRNGHTKARAERVTRPLLLDMSVLHQHVDQVIRDVELGEPLANSWRILQDGRIKEAFLETGKRSDFEALELWLLDTASGDMISARGLEVFLRHMRSGFTISRLAINISTALIQPTGIMQSAVQIGKKPMARGMIEYMRHPQRWVSDVVAASSLMRERERTFQRDVLHTLNAAQSEGPAASRWKQFQREWALPLSFVLIQKTQFYTVDMPTWIGAYLKELERSGNEADARTFADSMVRRAQGSGLISDRGMLERGTTAKDSRQRELPRLLTALGSYMFAKFNVAYERTGRTNFRSPAEVMSFAADMALLFALETALYTLVKGHWPDEENDDENMAVWLAKETTLTAMGTLPIMREAAGAIQGFGSGGIQGSIVEALTRPASQMAQGEFDKALVKSFWNAAAVMLHLPGSQAAAMIDAVFDEDMRVRSDTAPIEFFIKQSD